MKGFLPLTSASPQMSHSPVENVEMPLALENVPVVEVPRVKTKINLKKAKPVVAPVPVVEEVLDEMPIASEACAIAEVEPEYKKMYEDLLIKYNALALAKTKVVRAKSVPKYAFQGKTYEAEKLSETKDDEEKVPEVLYGVKVAKGKCGSDVLFTFKVVKYDKKNMLPLVVKDLKSGMLYKNAGGAIEVSEEDEIYRVYLLKNMKEC